MKRIVIDAMLSAGTCLLAFAFPFILLILVGLACRLARTTLPLQAFPVAVLASLLSPWFAIRMVQSKYQFAIPFPMNAFGGATMGFGLFWWFIIGSMMAVEYVKRGSKFDQFLIFIAPVLIMAVITMVAGTLAALVKRNIAVPLLIASPLVAVASMLFIMFYGRGT